jgi:isocitrate dehydrogenase (NAD+)
MFEAIHGSAPRMIERGDGDYANPASMLRAAELLLKHIGFIEEASKLGKALDICTRQDAKLRITGRKDGATCKEFGDYIMEVCESL